MVSSATKQKRALQSAQRANARRMRKEPTQAELRFWYEVRDRRLGNLKFRRQVPIGPYIADFLCSELNLIIEIDGGQHTDDVERDTVRDQFLQSQGFTVLRFWNHKVMNNMRGIAEVILAKTLSR
jgi:very-short-patch-repair endonuclease